MCAYLVMYKMFCGYCSLTVCRDTLLLDAYEEVMSCSARDLRKMAITISFYGEEGYVLVCMHTCMRMYMRTCVHVSHNRFYVLFIKVGLWWAISRVLLLCFERALQPLLWFI